MTDDKTITIAISIDCEPYQHGMQEIEAEHIFKNILKREYRDANHKFFGCWTWCGVECTKAQQEKIKESLTDAYENGIVRYASWSEA